VLSSLSAQRKKLRGDGGSRTAKSGRCNAAEPTLGDLLKVKDLAIGRGGVEEISALVEKVDAIAGEVGGIDKLRASLDALKKLTK